MVRDVSRLYPGPAWAVRGEEGPGSSSSHPSPACRAWRPQPLPSAWPPTAGNRLGVLRSCLCFTLGERCPSPSSRGGGRRPGTQGSEREGGKSSGCGGAGPILGTLGQFSRRCQLAWKSLPASPSTAAPWALRMAGSRRSPKQRPPGSKARDGHKGVLVAQGLGTGGNQAPQQGARFLSEKAATMHRQAAAPGTGGEGCWLPWVSPPKSQALSMGPGSLVFGAFQSLLVAVVRLGKREGSSPEVLSVLGWTFGAGSVLSPWLGHLSLCSASGSGLAAGSCLPVRQARGRDWLPL